MTHEYVIVDSKGAKHYITRAYIQYAYRLLLQAGYEATEAKDLAIDWINARIQISAIAESDLVYQNHSFVNEDRLLSQINHKLLQANLLEADNFAEFE
ncbi:hypothetical protein [Polynucleobacter sp. JS-JIR-5-A7]|uniref:hypothetical protein n=1 Tax=Polynucleobacter sp. JS-JIR-5-A7 TaxID=1758395 RepID=UPI001BFE15C8|nr:hypothetical protein [Polynucleobacter sp. JS-JIR-5-A7]QWE06053.1 hypothetical protein AOC29_08000 [Polynucleobacter sp. JS-JIR-5-A7]